MRKTSDLIDALVASATPVRRLRPQLIRVGIWLALAAIVVGLLSVAHGIRPDISMRLQQPVFMVSMIGALATAILAALASFELSLPDGSRWWILLPFPPLAVWVSTIGYGCLTDWVSMGVDGVRMGEAVSSFSDGGRIASEGENEGAGGSCTRDNAICRCTFLLSCCSSFRAAMVWSRRVRVEVEIR